MILNKHNHPYPNNHNHPYPNYHNHPKNRNPQHNQPHSPQHHRGHQGSKALGQTPQNPAHTREKTIPQAPRPRRAPQTQAQPQLEQHQR